MRKSGYVPTLYARGRNPYVPTRRARLRRFVVDAAYVLVPPFFGACLGVALVAFNPPM